MRRIIQNAFLVLTFVISLNSFSQEVNSRVIRIKVKPEHVSKFDMSTMKKSATGCVQTGMKALDTVNERLEAVSYRRVFADGGKFEARRRKFGLHLWYEVEFKIGKKETIQNKVNQYVGLTEVEKAEPVYEKSIIGIPGVHMKAVPVEIEKKSRINDPKLSYIPNDPRFAEQWHYNNTGQTSGTADADIDLPEAWNTQKGNSDVIVAIIDGGIDVAHEDLAGNLWVNVAERDGVPGVDDDGNGYIDDINGYNLADGQGAIAAHPHGTHVAGTVAAVNNNGIGVSGVAGGSGAGDGARLMSVQVFSGGSGGFAESFAYAADNGAVISQNSWGYTSAGFFEQAVLDGIDYFIANAGYDAGGIPFGPMQGGIVIFAAGNDDSSGQHYPGYYEPTLAVASTNHNDQKAWYSNYGDWVDIAAPGGETNTVSNQGVLSTLPGNTYGFYQGTSMACPHVSGVAALIVAEYGAIGFTAIQLRARLTETVDDIDASNPTFIGMLGSGRMNAAASLLTDDGIAPDVIADLDTDNILFDEVRLTWTAPIDVDNGSAASYEIRYSESVLDAGNFSSGTLGAYAAAQEAGISETINISGLSSSTQYYFAIKSVDFFGNVSDISNVIDFTTPLPPEISVTPLSLTSDLFTGDIDSQSITISNNGASDLTFESAVSYVSLSSLDKQELVLTEIIGEFKNPENSEVVKVNSGSISVSTADLTGINIAVFTTDYSILTSDIVEKGGNVDVVNYPLSDVSSYDVIVVNDVISSFSTGDLDILLDFVNGGGKLVLEADNGTSETNVEYLVGSIGLDYLSFSFTDETITDIEEHPTTEGVNSIAASAYGAAYVGSSNELIRDSQGRVQAAFESYGAGMFFVMGNEYLIDFNFDIPDNRIFANNIIDWLSTGGLFWLNLGVDSGTITAGNSEIMAVDIDASDLIGGTYEGEVVVQSNDPIAPQISIPVTLNVTGAPSINLSALSIDFGEVFIGTSPKDSVLVSNSGTDVLTISTISNSNSDYTTSINTLVLNAGEEAYLVAEFTPLIVGVSADIIEISSDDPSNAIETIDINGLGVEPPIIGVSPGSLTADLLTGETDTQTLTIENTGGSDLVVNILTNVITTAPTQIIQSDKYGDKNETDNSIQYLNRYDQFANLLDHEKNLTNDDLTVRNGFIELLSDSTVIYYEDMESGATDWSHYATSGTVDQWSLSATRSNSGVTSYNVAQHASGGEDALESPYISLDGASEYKMSFWNWYDFDDCGDSLFNPDGGVVEISTDGVTWTKLIPEALYPYTLDVACDNPLSSEDAFAHSNDIFEVSIFDLSPFANESVKIRFKAGWDCGNCDSNEGWYIDDVVIYSPITWISTLVSEVVVQPGMSESIDVEFDATGLFGGVYEGEIIVQSNDPITSEAIIPVTLNVTGAPDIQLSGTSLVFEDVFIGSTLKDSVLISNTGTDMLTISTITNVNTDFETSISTMMLNPTEESYLAVDFNPTVTGIIADVITITSDDPDQPVLTIDVNGVGVEPPLIGVAPGSLTSDLLTGETETQTLTIDNTGGSDLEFELSIVNFAFSNSSIMEKIKSTQNVERNNTPNNEVNNNDIVLTYTEYNGDYIKFGLSEYGEIMPFQYAIGNEHLAFGTWASGYTLVYEADGTDYVTYSAYHTRSGITPISYTELENNASRLEVEVITQTSDTKLQITRNFVFVKDSKSISIKTSIENISAASIDNVVLKSFADWDVDGDPGDDNWDVDVDRNMIYAFDNSYVSIATFEIPDFVDMNGWDDYQRRLTNEDVLGAINDYDGFELLHYELGSLTPSQSKEINTAFASGDDLSDLQLEVDKVISENWLAIDISSGIVESGLSEDLTVTFDAAGLYGGIYGAEVLVSSNDPATPDVFVPVTLNVTGAPDIQLSVTSLDFGEVFIGASKKDSVLIANIGTDVLTISSITNVNTDYETSIGTIVLNPTEEAYLVIDFTPTLSGVIADVIIVTSDDPDQPVLTIDLNGVGVEPPVIEVSPISLTSNLFTGETEIQQITITNNGDADLDYNLSLSDISLSVTSSIVAKSDVFKGVEIPLSKAEAMSTVSVTYNEDEFSRIKNNDNNIEQSSANDIDVVLEELNSNYNNLTSLVPNLHEFSNGNTGSSISDGGNDMYDGGNFLSTNLGSSLAYTNGALSSSAIFNNENYFTAKYPGLFVLAADISNVDYFEITGDLGADGSGSVDGIVLNAQQSGASYYGFVKRVYSTSDPSVNHLIIVEDNGSANHEFSTDTNSDQHRALNINGTSRIYYLLYASANGGYVDDATTLLIMKAFLEIVGEVKGISIPGITTGVLVSGESTDIDVDFDATSLFGGIYEAEILISSNDPITPEVTVPATLNVTGAPDIQLSATSVDFGDVHKGTLKKDSILISNIGTDVLTISTITNVSTDFEAAIGATVLNPTEEAYLVVEFTPSVVGSMNDVITITSDDPDQPAKTLNLSGIGIGIPTIEVNPSSLTSNLLSGNAETQALTIDNIAGEADLNVTTVIEYVIGDNWLAIDQGAFTVAEGAQLISNVSFDASNLNDGNYEAIIRLNSNDLSNPQLEIPIYFNVTGIPDIEVVTSTIDFEDVFVGGQGLKTIEVYNAGTAQLIVEDVVSTSGEFTIAGYTSTLEIGENSIVEVYYMPTAAGVNNATIDIITNDPDESNYEVALTGNGILPPVISANETQYTQALMFGQQSNQTIEINNIGSEDLVVKHSAIDYVNGVNWLSIDKDVFTVIGGSQIVGNIGFDATNIADGNYDAAITFYSNDPITPTYVVNVSLQVCNDLNNLIPEIIKEMDLVGLDLNQQNYEYVLSDYFVDGNNDPLTYSIYTNTNSIVLAEISGGALIINPIAAGNDMINLTINDGNCGVLDVGIVVSVVDNVTAVSSELKNENFEMHNYPNPFSNSTTIAYFVHTDGNSNVNLTVYSLQGKLITVLVDDKQSRGAQHIEFNTKNMQSGIYLYQLNIDDVITVKRMMIK